MAYQSFYNKKRSAAENEDLQILKKRIKEKTPSGVYIFRGEEEYMKRFYFSELCKSAGDTDANVNIIDSSDFTYEGFLDAVNTAPAIDYSDSFFADEADFSSTSTIRIIKADSPKLHKLSERECEDLERLCETVGEVCVVFYFPYNPKEEKDHAKSLKILQKCTNIIDVEFFREAPTSPQLKKWVKKHFDSKKVVIDAQSVDYLIEAVGNDMCTLISEIEKLCAYAVRKNLPAVYNEDIDFICIRNTAAKIDDVAKGVVEGNYNAAISALYRLKNEEETYIFGAISKKIGELCTVDHYKNKGLSMQEIAVKTGMRDFVVKNNFRYLSELYSKTSKNAGNPCDRMVKILSEYDTKLKSYPTNKFLLLENMVFKLCKR